MGGNEIAGYAASGALGLFVIVKGLSRAIIVTGKQIGRAHV